MAGKSRPRRWSQTCSGRNRERPSDLPPPTDRDPGITARAPVAEAGTAAVEFRHVSLAFDNLVVLRDLSFTLPAGSMTILLGASGSGKSVLLKLILGLLKPDEGSILVNGEAIERMAEHELLRVRENIGIVFQENALFDSLTVEDNVGYRLVEEHLPEDQVHARVEAVLGFIGLSEFIDRLPSELSGGQRRRVAIARAMAPEPSLVLLDDPITGLDPDHRDAGGRRDHQAARSAARDVAVRHAPDSRRVLCRHPRRRPRRRTGPDRQRRPGECPAR